ncbi:conserved hypothetical protein [Formosa agariphila KMM 3901]|uniref:DUF3575 domain-containing protein n=1 Tax=Formosa agariphila (strain DSM 15362 / KCTC 12365 / LMG 23005 / KMM 3901 / M-2Alg 35-1) TaxID=1347342 RepID=T2KS68_FORAG|nr:hypothetical protein [Formosa agariphila]CDF80984.1 conserved hypothetical protein [Formosa agariphila KMM 3901]
MRNLLSTFCFFIISIIAYAQTTTVEKSIYGIQTGFLGFYANNEARLTNSIALRSELGLDAGFWGSDVNDINGYLLAPVLTLEPRWYYNLKKRTNKGRRTANNTGNFVSLKTSYHPDWFTLTNADHLNFIGDFTIIPTWGIRRHLGNHFNYETGIGIGYGRYLLNKNDYYYGDKNVVAVNLHLRIGYSF